MRRLPRGPRTLHRHVRALLRLRVRTERYGPPGLQQHPAGARATTGWLRRVPRTRRTSSRRCSRTGRASSCRWATSSSSTALLIQKGSAESKDRRHDPHDADPGGRAAARRAVAGAPGWTGLKLYEHSLSLVLFSLFVLSLRAARRRRRARVQRRPGSARGEDGVGTATWDRAVLVRVVAELAERVPGGGGW